MHFDAVLSDLHIYYYMYVPIRVNPNIFIHLHTCLVYQLITNCTFDFRRQIHIKIGKFLFKMCKFYDKHVILKTYTHICVHVNYV